MSDIPDAVLVRAHWLHLLGLDDESVAYLTAELPPLDLAAELDDLLACLRLKARAKEDIDCFLALTKRRAA